jgi:hypothetical protein
MRGSVLTNKLTGTMTLGFEAPGAEMVIWPVQVPAVNPDVFICTLNVLGVAPLLWFRTIQFPQFVVWAVALKLTLAPVLLLSTSASASGAAVPSW